MNDKDRKQLVLYNKNGQLLITKCVEIEQITILNGSLHCFEQCPITFIYKAVELKGFLDQDGIIIRSPKLRDCRTSKAITIAYESR